MAKVNLSVKFDEIPLKDPPYFVYVLVPITDRSPRRSPTIYYQHDINMSTHIML